MGTVLQSPLNQLAQAPTLAAEAAQSSPAPLKPLLSGSSVAPAVLLSMAQLQLAQAAALPTAAAGPGFDLALPQTLSAANLTQLLPTSGGNGADPAMSQPVIVVWCVQAGAAPLCSTAVQQ